MQSKTEEFLIHKWGFYRKTHLNCVEYNLPTPPLPDNINIFLLTFRSLSAITLTSGSGPLGTADAQIF